MSETGPLPPNAPARLRASAEVSLFHVVLVEPEIPPNTGNIARLCAATSCPLHLVHPLGFRTDAHAVRRAGLDYWHLVTVHEHQNLDSARRSIAGHHPESRSWFFSGRAEQSYLDVQFRAHDALIFGKESTGLDDALLASHRENVVGIPTLGAVRSLNLGNAVSIALYEALRQIGALKQAVNPHPFSR